MKKLLLALLLWPSLALGQFAVTTTTAPTGDNTNRIASTAFAQAAISAPMPANTIKCNQTTSAAPPQNCPGNGYINVRQYAVCDGVTDDSNAIATADAAAASQGKALYFPAGTCVAQGLNPRRSNLEWFGDGPYLSVLKFFPGSLQDTLVWFGERTATTQYSTLYVHDLGFNGNGLGTNAVVEVRSISFSTFAFLQIYGGSNVGLRGETSTTTINTNLVRNNFLNIETFNNAGRGIYISGDKDSGWTHIFSHNNTAEGIYWGPANLNSSALCETTEDYGTDISSRDNGGDGVVFDEVEKFVIGDIQTSINGGYGVRFKSTYTGCAATGSNSVNIASLTARNDALGGFRVSDSAYMYGAKFGSIWVRGDNSNVSTIGMQLDGVAHTQFGSVQIEGWPGTALLIQQGTPLGNTTQSNDLQFASLMLASNGNAGSAQNHGMSLLNSSTIIQVGSLISTNLQTSGSNFEINMTSTSSMSIGNAKIAASGGTANNFNVGGGAALQILSQQPICTTNVQAFTSGTNATFNTPTCNGLLARALALELTGAGGGGAGSGTSPGAATAGTASCWNTSGTACSTPVFSMGGGGLGTSGAPGTGGAAGSATGSGTCDDVFPGQAGQSASGATGNPGGAGGGNLYGPGGFGGNLGNASGGPFAGQSGPGWGAGGGGASMNATANAGAGGGSSPVCRVQITAPAISYVYTIGSGGTGGTAGTSGAAGAAGVAGRLKVTATF